MISPNQSRAARALVGWTQADLAERAKISIKTIADFERDARFSFERTQTAIRAAFEDNGVRILDEGEEGIGVRLRNVMPRLFRRDDVSDKEWVAFAFDYRGKRWIGFITYTALIAIGLNGKSHLAVFDEFAKRVLRLAAEKVDKGALDQSGRVLIDRLDLEIVEYNF